MTDRADLRADVRADLARRLSVLSPAQRAALELRLQDGADGEEARALLARLPIAAAARGDAAAEPALLSFAQQRFWFLAQLDPASAAHNVPVHLRLRGRLDVEALRRALDEVVARHDVLRTTFALDGGQPVQVVRAASDLPALEVVDLRSLPDDERQRAAERAAAESTLQPFDLATGPLLRRRLLRLADDESVLLLCLHHIVSDGWSMGVLGRELHALYAAFRRGEPSPLPPLPIQYADYARWQRGWLQGEALARQLGWWKEHLRGAPRLLELPADRPRPAVRSQRGGVARFAVDAKTTARVDELARTSGATTFIVLLAAYAALLAKSSGQQRVVVGTPLANRNRGEIEPLMGCFVSTLPLHFDLAGDPSFRQLVERTREATMAAFAHGDLPLELLIEELGLPRESDRTPLFQAAFTLENAFDAELELPGLEVSALEADRASSRFDVGLSMWVGREGLGGALEYSSDLFDRTTAQRMAGHFGALLRSAVEEPDRRLSQLERLPAGERHQLVVEWNDSAREGAGAHGEVRGDGQLVHQRFAAQAARRPEAMAVVGELGRLRYGELAERASALARRLRARGVGPEVMVGVCCRRSPGMLVALLGILEAGGAYVPLDPSYPREWLDFVLADSGVALVVTDAASAGQVEGRATIVLAEDGAIVDGSRDDDARAPLDAAPVALDPEHLAYLLYTSGSTGRPKGVAVRHSSLAHVIGCSVEQLAVTEDGRVLQVASLSFDASALEIFTALTSGAAVCLADRESLMDGPRLGRLLRAEAVTTMMAVPSILRLIPDGEYPAVTGVMAGGEACPADVAARWSAGRRFFNVYAPTENTIYSTATAWRAGSDGSATPPVGRPIPGATAHLLDGEMQPLPVGALGEIYLGGAGLARGYHRRPGLTAERFVPDPFATEPGARLYRTGDLGRRLADGRLDFAGRADHQVKVRGHRVELGEIEAALAAHEAVARCAVVPWRDAHGELRLAAYVEPHYEREPDGRGPESAELRRFLETRLPAYMVPAVFVRLASLPLLSSGKVDRRALPAPVIEREAERTSEGPRTANEATLLGIWRETLGVETIGVHDNFFDLGGDSILSIQIVSRARQAGLELTPRLLFEHQTIAALAAVATAAAAPLATAIASSAEAVESAPATPVQAWFLEQELAEPNHFNMPVLLAVDAALDVTLLSRALAALVERHDALRLVLERDGDGWRQRVLPPQAVGALEVVDLRALPTEERAVAMSAAAADVQASLRLEGPLLRAVCFELGDERRLLLAAHHLVVDAVSWTILLDELASASGQLRRGDGVDLGPPPTSFVAWADGLARAVAAGAWDEELPYWRGLRGEAEPLPRDHESAAAELGSTRIVSAELAPESTRLLLQEAGRAYGTEPLELLLAAVVGGFARWTGRDSLLLHLEGHGREDVLPGVDVTRTVGWFTSLCPLRLSTTPDGNAGEQLKPVKEQLRSVPRRGIGYGLLRHLHPQPEVRAELAALPRPEVSFNYLGQLGAGAARRSGAAAFAFADEPIGPSESPRNVCLHLLELQAAIADGRLRFHLRYSEAVHRRDTAEALLTSIASEAEALVAHCTAPGVFGYTPSDFPLAALAQAELDLVATRFAGAGRGLERLYPLSPMQEGMLFHSLYADGAGEAEPYLEQVSCELRGALDADAFEEAWRRVIARHDAMRTSFLWEGLERPLQCVHRQVPFALARHDWSDVDDAGAAERLQSFVDDDGRRGMDLRTAPLFRMAWIRRSAERAFFVWAHHHAVLDGWSLPILIEEVLAIYRGLTLGVATPAELSPPGRYEDFIAWLERQDAAAREPFWRAYLDGFQRSGPTPLPHDLGTRNGARRAQPAAAHRRLDAATASALQELAARERLTVGTLVQGAWALLLHRHSGRRDLLFGTTSAGRPAELAGADRTVGLFINTLPLRVDVDRQRPLTSWLADLQRGQLLLRQHEATPLRQIQAWSDLPRGAPLFESLVVVENQPLDAPGGRSQPASESGIEIHDVRSHIRNSLPLTLTAFPHGGLGFRLLHDPERVTEEAGRELLAEVEALLTVMAREPGATVAEVLAAAAREDERRLQRRLDEGRAAHRERLVRQRSARLAMKRPAAATEVEP